MAGRRVQHLEQRNGVFYIRLPVPMDLRRVLERSEMRWSLRTRERRLAVEACLVATLAFRRMCASVRAMINPSEDEIRAAVDAYYRRVIDRHGPAAYSDERERDAALSYVEDLLVGLKAIIDSDDYTVGGNEVVQDALDAIQREARQAAVEVGIDLDRLREDRRLMLMQGVARAMAEEQRRFIFRMNDRVSPYEPRDPLFANQQAPVPQEDDIPTFKEAATLYLGAKSGVSWTKKTEAENQRVFRWAVEHFGEDTRISSIATSDIRSFRDRILKLRRKGSAKARFADLTASEDVQSVGPITAAKYFGYVVTAFSWWVDEGLISTSPVGKISVTIPKSKRSTKRPAFSQADLNLLFNSPMYIGCQGALRRMKPGPEIVRDGRYWVPLIGALSGMRLGEIVQLGHNDVEPDSLIPSFRVRADPEVGGTVKSDAGWRDVPIHRRLIELGLLTFIDERRGTEIKRLFSDIPYGSDGAPSSEYSKCVRRHRF